MPAAIKGMFRSPDAGVNWEKVPIHWPDNFQIGRVHALLVVEE